MNYFDFEDGFVPNVPIIVSEERKSLVLDRTGEPFILINKNKIGFDLKPKRSTNG
jgi:hypothetical protein